jgi:hypothetical protein
VRKKDVLGSVYLSTSVRKGSSQARREELIYLCGRSVIVGQYALIFTIPANTVARAWTHPRWLGTGSGQVKLATAVYCQNAVSRMGSTAPARIAAPNGEAR